MPSSREKNSDFLENFKSYTLLFLLNLFVWQLVSGPFADWSDGSWRCDVFPRKRTSAILTY